MTDLFAIYENNLTTLIHQISKIVETFSNLSKGK